MEFMLLHALQNHRRRLRKCDIEPTVIDGVLHRANRITALIGKHHLLKLSILRDAHSPHRQVYMTADRIIIYNYNKGLPSAESSVTEQIIFSI